MVDQTMDSLWVREQEIDPKKYYPKGYHPQLLEEWPVDSDLVVPLEAAPADLIISA